MKLRTFLATAAVIALAATMTASVNAAPASNDDIADAISLTAGVEQRFSDIDATKQATELVCGGDDETVWYSFTAATAGDYVAYVEGSDHDTEVGWSDALAGPSVCSDDAFDSYDATTATLTLAAGEQQYVQVSSHTDGEVGRGGVGVTRVIPAVDDFADATPLSFVNINAPSAVIAVQPAGTETGETGEPADCGATSIDSETIWLNFVSQESGTWMIQSKSAAATDIAVYTGNAVDDLTLLNCATSLRIGVLIDTVAGQNYRVQIGVNGVTAPIVVRAEKSPAPMTAQLVDSDGSGTSTDVGDHSHLAFVDGEPAIAYYDESNGELRYAARTNGTWTDKLVDANGDGTSTDVGFNMSLAVNPSGDPAIAYYDVTNGELRYAARTNGTWTDKLVDANGDGTSTDVGWEPSLLFLANGNPAIAYSDISAGELRYAERVSGTWSDTLVDDDGDGTSTDTGLSPDMVQYSNGDLGVGYVDNENFAVRYAKRVSGTWSDELVYDHPTADFVFLSGTVLNSDNQPIVTANLQEQGNHIVGLWNGASWDLEFDGGDRDLAQLDYSCSYAETLIDANDVLYIVWTDCNNSLSMAMSVREADGDWRVHDMTASIVDPSDPAFAGVMDLGNTYEFGAAFGPDGRMAVTFQLFETQDLWYAEDALVAVPGGDTGGPAASDLSLDGSGSSDAWGSIASYAWSAAPAGCTFSDTSIVEPTLRCVAPTTGSVTLTVTDTDGFTHAASMKVTVTNAECDATTDPFTDVPASSFAAADVTCIFNLAVTTGTSGTTYSPGDFVTREQMASFLARMYEAITGSAAPAAATPFTDVSATSFAKDDIGRIFGLGITTGTSGTTYSPGDNVTREQMASFLARLFNAIRAEQAPITATPFTDVSATSFAKDDIGRIFGLGITTGTSPTTYDPAGNVTREQMAAFLARLYRAD